ncbi:MAG: hypothetical protein ACP5IM_01630 [Candidatus Bathyarchaeia archaeon]
MSSPPKKIKTLVFTRIVVVIDVPSEIFDAEKFVEISGRAEYCAVKRLKDVVKLKLRTAGRLYTLKVEPAKAEEVIKKLQCEIREI